MRARCISSVLVAGPVGAATWPRVFVFCGLGELSGAAPAWWGARWLTLGGRVSGRVGKRGGGSARFGRLRKSSPTSRVGASTWVGIGSRGVG